jgi:hypothetical protein
VPLRKVQLNSDIVGGHQSTLLFGLVHALIRSTLQIDPKWAHKNIAAAKFWKREYQLDGNQQYNV